MPITITVGKKRDVIITPNGTIIGQPQAIITNGESITIVGLPVLIQPGNAFQVTLSGVLPGTSTWEFRNTLGFVLATDTVTVTIDAGTATAVSLEYGEEY